MRRRNYQAAAIDRITAGWTSNNSSADQLISGSLSTIRNRSRQLVRDNDYARNVVRVVVDNVLGARGILLQPKVRQQRGQKLSVSINQALLEHFIHWSAARRCHVAGRHSWREMLRLALATVVQSGEVFIRLIDQPFGGGAVPLALEIIEPDLCDHLKTGRDRDGSEWRMGVRVDKWGRPVGYWMLDHHPMDITTGRGRGGREIPADEVLHLFIAERPGQTRGVPWFVSAARRLHQTHGYEDAALTRARAAAALMGLISNPDGEAPADDVEGDDRLLEFEAGMFRYLQPGETIQTLDFNAPAGELAPFIRVMLQGVSAGLGISYSALSQDYSQSNYSSSRLSELHDREQWKGLQQWLIEAVCEPVYERWAQAAIGSGLIPGVGLEQLAADPARLLKAEWRPRGWSFVDPLKEGRAAIEQIEARIKTRREVVMEQGRDWDQLVEEMAAEEQQLKDLGLAVAAPIPSAAEPDPSDDDDNPDPPAASGA